MIDSFFFIAIPKVTKVEPILPLPLANFLGRDVLNLQCEAEGNPNPELRWEFNGTKISNSDKYRIPSSLSGKRLQVFDVTLKDSGAYRCVATNLYGSTFGQVNLHIHG